MSKTVVQLTIGVILAIVAAVLGALGERYRTGEETRTRYLDYRIDRQPVYLPEELPGKKLEITLDGERIDNLSWVVIELYNLSDRDFAEVPLYIDLVPRRDSALSIISSYVWGPEGTPESFEETVLSPPPGTPPGTIRVGYKMGAANRSRTSHVFRASFFLRGEAVNTHVFTRKSGLELRSLDVGREEQGPLSIVASLPGLLLLIGLTVGLALVATRFERRSALKRDAELRDRLTRSLADEDTRAGLRLGADADAAGLAGHFVRTLQRFRWEKVPRGLRVFASVPPPREA
jgi:hypothetical protein